MPHVGVGRWPALAHSLDQWPELRRPGRVDVRQSESTCASSELRSSPKLIFGFKLRTSLLGHNHLCTGPEAFWTKTHGRKGFIWSRLKVIWVYELDFSNTILDHLLLFQ